MNWTCGMVVQIGGKPMELLDPLGFVCEDFGSVEDWVAVDKQGALHLVFPYRGCEEGFISAHETSFGIAE